VRQLSQKTAEFGDIAVGLSDAIKERRHPSTDEIDN